MQNVRLQNAMSVADSLPFTDKLTLAEYLIRQVKQDTSVPAVNGVQTNGEAQHNTQASPRDNPDPARVREYEWLKHHRDEYAGQYVAVFDNQLISHGTNLRAVIDEAHQAGYEQALMIRIEALDEPPFGGW